MKVVMLSKALVSGAYQKKLEELAQIDGIDLVVLVPPAWREPRVGLIRLERQFVRGYRLEVLPIVANGQHHLHFYPTLRQVVARERPDIFHIDEEAFNFATFLAMRIGVHVGARCCFYNWANMDRFYPPPFCFFERYTFRHAYYGIVGNRDAATIIRRHGYHGPIAILPQFGVDPNLFSLRPTIHTRTSNQIMVGYFGRLVAEKGVTDLVEVIGNLPSSIHLLLVGDGELRAPLERHVHQLGIADRVQFQRAIPSTEVPSLLHKLDMLVLPSRASRTWKEQFGRILIEAMSCGIPVIGSSCGEIPYVLGDAGIVVPEGDRHALRDAILRVAHDAELRNDLRTRGRARVLAHYTHAILARHYYDVYATMMEMERPEMQ